MKHSKYCGVRIYTNKKENLYYCFARDLPSLPGPKLTSKNLAKLRTRIRFFQQLRTARAALMAEV